MAHYDYIILGAGISGLTFGRLLQQHTDKTFLILEKEHEAGGLCRTRNVDGNYFDIGGGHFLYSKHQKAYDFIFSQVPKERFVKHNRITKIKIHDTYIDYPIENNIWQLPEELQYKYLCSIIDALKLQCESTQGTVNFEQYITTQLGTEIYNNYLKPYNAKAWGVPATQMSTDWVYKILPIDVKEILKAIVYKQADNKNMPSHQCFYYPSEGGFQIITDAICEPLKEHIKLGQNIYEIERYNYASAQKQMWTVNGKYTTKNIINTVPWGALPLRNPHPAIANLKHNSVVVSLHKQNYDNNYQWTYIPDEAIPQHREFFVNNYSTSNKDKCIACETNESRFNIDMMPDECMAQHNNEYAYPIPTLNHAESIKQVLAHYEKQNMHGLGRWGTWQYHNSDVCIYQAMELFNKLENKSV